MSTPAAWLASAGIVIALGLSSFIATRQIDAIRHTSTTTTTVVDVWQCGQLTDDTPVACWVANKENP